MKKTKTIEKRVKVEETTDILCNKCGRSCVAPEGKHATNKEQYSAGLIEQEVVGCYHSTDLEDATCYKFSLCEKCVLKLFNSFKLPVEIKADYTGMKYVSLKDKEKIQDRMYKDMESYKENLNFDW